MTGDRELLAQWREGDANAGNRLFERHFDSVYRFFRNKLPMHADDLVQQTFLACVRSRDAFREGATFRTYLFTVARSKLYDELRRRSSRPAADFGDTSLVDLGVSPSAKIAGKEEYRAALAALRQLPLDLQIAVELYYIEGLRGPELASALEIPEGTVRSRLRRALDKLKEFVHATDQSSADQQVQSTLDNLGRWADEVCAHRG